MTELDYLKSIDTTLKALLAVMSADPAKPCADDKDLDGKYGDPEVKFLPRDWTGEDFKGQHFSDCDPAFLDMLAEMFDYFAQKAEEKNETYNGKPTAPYKRKDAARARGWARRIRANGYTPQSKDTTGSGWAQQPGDSDIPF